MGSGFGDINLSGKTVLVTGGAGFIGSHLVEHLAKNYPGYHIIVLDALTYAAQLENTPLKIRKADRFEFWQGDVRNDGLVNELVGRSDIVVHLAAESHVSRSIYSDRIFFETNVMGTQTVANAVHLHQSRVERFIHISTSEVYGTATQVPMTEDHSLNPLSPYASAKAGADRLVYSYWATYKIPVVIVRPFNNYGPRQHLEKLIPRFITRALQDQPLTVHGDGSASRDWIHVRDHCEALDRLMHVDLTGMFGQAINLGTSKDTTNIDIARTILRLLDKPESLITHIAERPGQVHRHVASYEKAMKMLDWAPKTSLEDGLFETIEWYRANEEWWRPLEWLAVVPIRAPDGTIHYH